MNNDFGQGHESLITGRSAKSGELKQIFGTFHLLPVELQTSLINFAKNRAPIARCEFTAALKRQDAACRIKEEIALQQKLDATQEDYIVAIYFWEQFHSPWCWSNISMADEIYNKL